MSVTHQTQPLKSSFLIPFYVQIVKLLRKTASSCLPGNLMQQKSGIITNKSLELSVKALNLLQRTGKNFSGNFSSLITFYFLLTHFTNVKIKHLLDLNFLNLKTFVLQYCFFKFDHIPCCGYPQDLTPWIGVLLDESACLLLI